MPPRKKKQVSFRAPSPSHLTFFHGRLDLRNVLIVCVCIEIACVITGYYVYTWQKDEYALRLEEERAVFYEEANGYMAEILRLRQLLASAGINPRIGVQNAAGR